MSGKDSNAPDADILSRSTARPPAADEEENLDIAAAVRAAKTNTSAPAPGATAKIRPFELAEALAKLSSESDPSSHPPKMTDPPPTLSAPKGYEAEAEEQSVRSDPQLEAEAKISDTPPPKLESEPPAEATEAATEEKPPVALQPPNPFSPGMLLMIALGVGAIIYAYITANR